MAVVVNKNKLALLGGEKTIPNALPLYNSIGEEERKAVDEVMKSGILSKYLGCWHDDFYGGPKVREFESLCAEVFNVKHAISVNSWTSGLIAAVGAIGIEPGDEIIVTPWTMCASATAILHWFAIPVFADIDPKTFNICPKSIEKNISSRTKAIMSVDIFGQSADMNSIITLAKKYNLKVISDTAQSPGALYHEQFAGTLADVGGYSLNYHKHIHTGEGGILVTNDSEIAEKLMLIRNHAEAVVGSKGTSSLTNMIGYNFRLGEIECAIGIEQIKKLKNIVGDRQLLAQRLTLGLSTLPGLTLPYVCSNATHVYYIYPLKLDLETLQCSREIIVKALQAEGVTVYSGYQNVHLLPMFQEKIAYGSKGFPWSASFYGEDVSYSKGICPIAEQLHDESFIGLGLCVHEFDNDSIDSIVRAFHKVWGSIDEIRDFK